MEKICQEIKHVEEIEPNNEIILEEKLEELLNQLQSESDLNLLINYMISNMTGYEHACLSEISDDIVVKYPSITFVEAYEKLPEKYPKETKRCKILHFIKDARACVETCLL